MVVEHLVHELPVLFRHAFQLAVVVAAQRLVDFGRMMVMVFGGFEMMK